MHITLAARGESRAITWPITPAKKSFRQLICAPSPRPNLSFSQSLLFSLWDPISLSSLSLRSNLSLFEIQPLSSLISNLSLLPSSNSRWRVSNDVPKNLQKMLKILGSSTSNPFHHEASRFHLPQKENTSLGFLSELLLDSIGWLDLGDLYEKPIFWWCLN